MSINEIMLRRKNSVVVHDYKSIGKNCNKALLASLNKNLEPLGYTLSSEVIEALNGASVQTLTEFNNEIISILEKLTGANRLFKPFYPNFPQQVMEATEAELYLNAVCHYFSFWLVDQTDDQDNIWLPKYDKVTRKPLEEKIKLKVIKLATWYDYEQAITNLMAANTSVSETDKADIKYFVENNNNLTIPEMKHKENRSFVGSLLLAKNILPPNFCATATDVLRLAIAMSGGDVSLAEVTKFRNFTRNERRQLLNMLNDCGNIEEDMLRWEGRWIRLGEKLHPGEFKKLSRVTEAFKKLRNNIHIPTFNSVTEQVVTLSNTKRATTHLKARPGEFARRLDQLLRNFGVKDHSEIITAFREVESEVSTTVLLQVMSHFQHRNKKSPIRTFFPKGNAAKVCGIENNLTSLPNNSCDSIVAICQRVLADRFSKKSSMGKVYLDPALKEIIVPFSQRSASKAMRTLVRGSKLALEEGKDTIRFFIWWKQPDGVRVDLDLSASCYDNDWNYKSCVSYYELRNGIGCHSGDITSAPFGACEFIDINIPLAVKEFGRYIIMDVRNYTNTTFDKLPECYAGWMMRAMPQSGEVFDARTVQNKIDVTSSTKTVCPLIIDLAERKVIWSDVQVKHARNKANNLESQTGTMSLMGKALCNITKPNMYDLLHLHVQGRGSLCKTKSKADVVFDVDSIGFETDRIMSEFLS